MGHWINLIIKLRWAYLAQELSNYNSVNCNEARKEDTWEFMRVIPHHHGYTACVNSSRPKQKNGKGRKLQHTLHANVPFYHKSSHMMSFLTVMRVIRLITVRYIWNAWLRWTVRYHTHREWNSRSSATLIASFYFTLHEFFQQWRIFQQQWSIGIMNIR